MKVVEQIDRLVSKVLDGRPGPFSAQGVVELVDPFWPFTHIPLTQLRMSRSMSRLGFVSALRSAIDGALSEEGYGPVNDRVWVRPSKAPLSEEPSTPRQAGPTKSGPATYSVAEAAKFIGVSPECIYHSIGNGEIPVVRIGRRVCILANWFVETFGDTPKRIPSRRRAG